MSEIFSVVGKSKRGKTTLLKQVISLLKERGHTVCVIKHSRHVLTYRDFDHEGKDTFCFSEAGADEVWLTSPSLTYTVKNEGMTLEEIISTCQTDFIFTEGFKTADTKKIVLKEPGESIEVSGEILAVIEGEYNLEDILELIIHS
jgi:molybdopterin-guanine dinucleotide biosynthesis protein B